MIDNRDTNFNTILGYYYK